MVCAWELVVNFVMLLPQDQKYGKTGVQSDVPSQRQSEGNLICVLCGTESQIEKSVLKIREIYFMPKSLIL